MVEIDVQGAGQVRAAPEAVSVFLRVSSHDDGEELRTLEQRLRGRGTESEEAIESRLQGARRELARAGEYDYQVVNDDLDAGGGGDSRSSKSFQKVTRMLDELKEEAIVNKVGGRFKLSTLIQKRMVALKPAHSRWSRSNPSTRWPLWCRRSCRTRFSWTLPARCRHAA